MVRWVTLIITLLILQINSCIIPREEQYEGNILIFLQKRILQNFLYECYSIDSVRFYNSNGEIYKLNIDPVSQEVFVYKTSKLFYSRKEIKKCKEYTTCPFANHIICAGDRYRYMNSQDSSLIIAFHIKCRLDKMEPNINCFYDESSYISPNAFITETDDENLEYSHLWDDYIDYRTFYNDTYYVIDSVIESRSLNTQESQELDLEIVDNSNTIELYGTW